MAGNGCPDVLETSLGRLSVVNQRKTHDEAAAHCESTAATLVPVASQEVIDEIVDGLYNCEASYWHVGLVARNGTRWWPRAGLAYDDRRHRWLFDGGRGLRPASKRACENTQLWPRRQKLLPADCDNDMAVKFLCMPKNSVEATEATAISNCSSIGSCNNAGLAPNTTRLLAFGLPVWIVIALSLVCIYLLAKKKDRSGPEGGDEAEHRSFDDPAEHDEPIYMQPLPEEALNPAYSTHSLHGVSDEHLYATINGDANYCTIRYGGVGTV